MIQTKIEVPSPEDVHTAEERTQTKELFTLCSEISKTLYKYGKVEITCDFYNPKVITEVQRLYSEQGWDVKIIVRPFNLFERIAGKVLNLKPSRILTISHKGRKPENL